MLNLIKHKNSRLDHKISENLLSIRSEFKSLY